MNGLFEFTKFREMFLKENPSSKPERQQFLLQDYNMKHLLAPLIYRSWLFYRSKTPCLKCKVASQPFLLMHPVFQATLMIGPWKRGGAEEVCCHIPGEDAQYDVTSTSGFKRGHLLIFKILFLL